MLPGINKALLEISFLGSSDFVKLHGFESRVTPVITPAKFNIPGNHDVTTDLYYAGSGVYPPGDHAGSSFLSGAMVTKMLVKNLK